MTVVYTVDDIDPSCTKFALFSGGNDSVVSTHLAYKKHDIDWTVYLDTNTGVPANTEHQRTASRLAFLALAHIAGHIICSRNDSLATWRRS
jgi:diphthamide synthase (EF-2-diphthine--ammonia ligase)